MPLISLNSGVSFNASDGESILEAGKKANIAMSYSCKTGRCRSCRCKVIIGSSIVLYPETGLTDQEKSDGWILGCVRAAETDLHLEVGENINLELPPVKTWPCRIYQITKMTAGVVRVLLVLPPSARFNFIPGQYVNIIGPGGIRRSYSLANASFDEKVLELHIRAVEGGLLSRYWFNDFKVNDLLRLNGPLGTFFLRETACIDLIFMATGTGIAPVKAMLESLISLPSALMPKSVTVLWGGRSPQDFYIDITNIQGAHKFIPVCSRPDQNWKGARGYVQDALLELSPDLSNASVYACGSNDMIQSAFNVLTEAGLSSDRFYSDAFVSSSI
jgi:CDP-4-dehydro-6-deoxyglucose reductase